MNPIWLIFFRWVETTNQSRWFHDFHLGKQLGISARHRAFARHHPLSGVASGITGDESSIFVGASSPLWIHQNRPKSREWIRNQGITHGILHGHDLSCDDDESYLSWWGYIINHGDPHHNHVWFHSLLKGQPVLWMFCFLEGDTGIGFITFERMRCKLGIGEVGTFFLPRRKFPTHLKALFFSILSPWQIFGSVLYTQLPLYRTVVLTALNL